MKFSIFVSVATYAVAVSARGHPHGIFYARTGTTTDLSACSADTDCASGCCGFTSAICEGPCVALQRDGCGHGNALSNSNAAAALGSCSSLVSSYKPSAAAGAPPAATPAANTNSASSGSAATSSAAGTITDTNACSADSDCASGCCGFTSGICEGPCVALQRDGCGHGTSLSNSNAAAALGTCSSLVSAYKPSAAAAAPPAATPAASSNSASSGSAATSSSGSSLTRGTQFITGPCSSNNDCVSGCCVASSQLCGATLAQAKGAAACTGGVALPNLDA